YITFSNFNDFVNFDTLGPESLSPRYTGRRINIAIIGLDSRIGTNSNHADANHILSILVDSGKIEIISVPRDTPAHAGFDDSTGQNKLTVVRAALGRNAYLAELARIAQLDEIHYYIEVVFSQVVGFLEFLGYRDPKSTLQVLRSRKGLGGDDYQRCYNQAQFIRQMILKNFNKINNGLFGDLLIRGALSLVTTNLTYDVVDRIISKLNMYGFPRSQSDIYIKIRPPIQLKLKIYDFTDQQMVDKLVKQIEDFNTKHNERDTNRVDISAVLDKTLSLAEADTSKNPKRVISRLSNFYKQRAWLQIDNNHERESIRQRFENCLVSAYRKLNQPANASKVQEELRLEREFFNLKHK
ncbi:MAG: LCP family protein, partial [Candidatus Kapaibacteriota bacterium]